jgi:hypothetical protein
MKRAWSVVVLLGIVGLASIAATPAPSVQKLRVKSVKLGVGNRVFTDFYDEVTARLNEEFRVGDSEFTALAVEFVPDFMMDMKTRRIVSRSNETRNPAVRILVRKGGAPNDTTWAFLNMPPHFGRHSMLAFKILRVEFENHAPLVAKPDSALATPKAGRP